MLGLLFCNVYQHADTNTHTHARATNIYARSAQVCLCARTRVSKYIIVLMSVSACMLMRVFVNKSAHAYV